MNVNTTEPKIPDDAPDKDTDEIWAAEADHRLRAYREGRLDSIPMEDIFDIE